MKKRTKHHIRRRVRPGRRGPGFALAEILIVVAIIGIAQALLFTSWRTQVDRGNDAKRKSDLAHIKIAVEDYYNDNNCYPPESVFATCGGTELAPYLPKMPCDPVKKKPYSYVPLDGDPCTGYRLLTTLDNKADADIARVGCNGPDACGFGPYNYGVSSGTVVVASGITVPGPGPTATPTPTGAAPPPTYFACTPQGACNVYADPIGSGCPVTYPEGTCANACGDPANRCAQ